jgi:TorA maturation chaperone TorD
MLNVRERKQLYAFFATLFSYPDEELSAALEGGEGVWAAGLFPEARQPPKLAGESQTEELQAAFTGLFINRLGGASAPPYGSVYLEGGERLMGLSTQSVAAAYRGEELSVDGSVEPADYLPTELEFLYFLVECEEEALSRGDVEEARSAVRKQGDFCRALLHPWVPEFCRRIRADRDAHPLYTWGAGLFERFCECEKNWLERLA